MYTLEEKIGQMFLVGFEGYEPPDHILDWLRTGRIGGVILFSRNVQSPQQLAHLTQQCHAAAKYPILIAVDQEGGDIARLRDGFSEGPGAMALGAAPNGIELAEKVAGMLGAEMRALGINWDYAPVVDLSLNAANPAVGTRSPGADKTLVSQIASAQVRGYQGAGVASCAKHFPGLGDTAIDTHNALPALDTPLDQLITSDLEPYRAVIRQDIASIMTTHTIYTALDATYPATLSPVIIHRLLRDELHYDGIVTTDCMEMKAVTDHYAPGESAVLAALASVDLLLYSHTRPAQEGAYEGLLAAVHSGRVPLDVIDQALNRILALKARYAVTTPPDLSVIRAPQHVALADTAARAGTTLLRTAPELFPLQPDTEQVGVIEFASHLDSGIFDTGGLTGFAKLLRTKAPHFKTVPIKAVQPSPESLERAMQLATESQIVVLVTRNAHLMPKQAAIARDVMSVAQRVILICLRNPYDVTVLPGAAAILCTCGGGAPAMQAAVDALLGEFTPPGTLPVELELNPSL
jgi:beta-N-acetylhexosaminidase